MKKKLLSILLCLCMVATLLPTVALATGPATSVWVGEVELTSTNPYTTNGKTAVATPDSLGTSYALFNSTTATLTLHNFTYSGEGQTVSSAQAAIYADGDLNIVLEGESSVIQTGNSSGSSCGVYCQGELTISGDGTLNATGGSATSDRSNGIYAASVAISGGSVVATGGNNENARSYGIRSSSFVTVSGGSVIAQGGNAGSGSASYGIRSSSFVTVSGGSVIAQGGNAKSNSYGIYGDSSVTLSGGVTVARAGTVDGSYSSSGRYAVYCDAANDIQLTDNTSTTKIAAAVGYNSNDTSTFGKLTDTEYAGKTITGTLTAADKTATGVVIVPTGWTVSGGETYHDKITISSNTAIVSSGETAVSVDADSLTISEDTALVAVSLYEGGKDTFGIESTSDLTITNDGTLLAVGGMSCIENVSYGLKGRDAALTFSGTGSTIAVGGTAPHSGGVFVYQYSNSFAYLTIESGNVLALGTTATSGTSWGLGASSVVKISGGTVTAIGGSAAFGSYGIFLSNSGVITLSGGRGIAVGGTSAMNQAPRVPGVNVMGAYTDNSMSWVPLPAYTMDFTATDAQTWAGNQVPATADCSGTGWDWTYSTKTLILSGLDFTTTADMAVKLPDGAEIVLADETSSTVKSGEVSASSYGIYGVGDMTISGGGALDATGGAAEGDNKNSYGIYAAKDVTISGFAAVTATGSKASGALSGMASNESYGICGSAVTISDSVTVIATGSNASTSCGILGNTTGVTINGGTVNAIGSVGASGYGICGGETGVTINGGTVTATAGRAVSSYGIEGYRAGVTVNGGTVTATGWTAAVHAFAAEPANMTVTGSMIDGTPSEATWQALSSNYTVESMYNGKLESIVAQTLKLTPNYTMDFTDTDASWGELSNVNLTTTDASGTGWSWVANTKTLTLSGLNFTTMARDAMYLPDGARIVLQEGTTNTVESVILGENNALSSTGIYAAGKLEISGSGTLNVAGGGVVSEGGTGSKSSSGIYGRNDITLSGAVTVNATGGAVSGNSGILNANSSYGVYSYNGTVSVTGSATVNAKGGAATAGGNEHAMSCGVLADGGSFEAKGGTVTATGGTATAGNGSGESCGICSSGNTTISGGTVTATGGTASSNLQTAADSDARYSYGISSRYTIISGGTVTAETTSTITAGQKRAFRDLPILTGYASYQWRTANSGAYTPSTTTAYTYAANHSYVEIKPYTAPSSPSTGGDSYTPSLVTEIKQGGFTTADNLSRLISGNKTLTVTGDDGAKLAFDTTALKGIDAKTTGSVTVKIEDVSKAHQTTHEGKTVFSLTVESGGKTISDFGGSVTVSLPYVLKDGERAEDVTVWYLASDGVMTEIACTYDAKTGLATFTVTHFSEYVVGVKEWVNPFSDVKEADWFYGDAAFVAAKSLMSGTSATTFAPYENTSRGMIVTILYRLEGQPAVTGANPFDDVQSGKYYESAIIWAAQNGIVSGYGNGKFGPDDDITREQMAAILYNYAKYKGYDMTATADLSKFADNSKISTYAVTAMSWANAGGLVTGKGNGILDPQGNAERCQVAAILHRFCENIVK